MRLTSVLLLTLCVFFGQLSYGQELHTDSRKAEKLYKEGLKAAQLRNFDQAISLLNQATQKDPAFVEAYLSLASIFNLYRNTERELYYNELALSNDPGMPQLKPLYLVVAKMQMQAGKYQQGLENVDKYLSFTPTGQSLKDASALKENLTFAIEAAKNPLPIEPVPLPTTVNAYPLQYFPVLTVDENTLIYTARQGFMDMHDEDLYISRKENGQWQKSGLLSTNINTEMNEGTCTISADGRTLIFTTCMDPKGYGSCDLYITRKRGNEWSVPENLGPAINTSGWESQPSLSADGRTLYFISERPDGFGGRDIYVAWQNDKGEWQGAKNLGDGVNTNKDEVSPFIHVNGRSLYFSSKGYPGMGGFDIYVSDKTSDGWSVPENLGYPLNNVGDQTSLFISASGDNAYYSVDKVLPNGLTASGIFTFRVPSTIKPDIKSNFLTGRILDKESGEPVKASIELFDLQKEERASVFQSDSITGEYYTVLNTNTEYALYVNSPGYLFKTSYFSPDSTLNSGGAVKDIYLDPIRENAVTTLSNIFFEVDSDKLVTKSIVELNKVIQFLDNNPEIKIRIEGHTDNTGSSAYNKDLSSRRAKSVYTYLLENGVTATRLSYEGFGSGSPVAPNDTEENRKLNRRIEFRIIHAG
ncbi:OmpA family protein [Roseivirga sp. BDSF3-8]|uniref:OmpA family protein n=1 Tax=Roseivirga sp. BDSF3-8 TaxID=3241598 RepID=UPI00353202C8